MYKNYYDYLFNFLPFKNNIIIYFYYKSIADLIYLGNYINSSSFVTICKQLIIRKEDF